MESTTSDFAQTFSAARTRLLDENTRALSQLDDAAWRRAARTICDAKAVFVIGNGRSRLASEMAAMRLMHLGLTVHVAGESTAPAVAKGDVVIAVSGSGTTATVVAAARTALEAGASVVAVTTASASALTDTSTLVLTIEAADKQDRSGSVTTQYAGSLFEQSVLLAFDALFHSMWVETGQTAETLWARHATIG